MRVTAEVGYLSKLKDDGSIFVGGYVDHVQAYLSHRDKSHRKKETYYPSSKMNRRDEMSKYLSQSSSSSHAYEGEALEVGDAVEKKSSDSFFCGMVVAVFPKVNGTIRLVVENPDGILHVMSPSQVERVEKDSPAWSMVFSSGILFADWVERNGGITNA